MAGLKRESAARSGACDENERIKRIKRHAKGSTYAPVKETETDSEPIEESDTTSQSGEDDGVSWPGTDVEEEVVSAEAQKITDASQPSTSTQNNSREAHAKQKALAQERKASKPNADLIARSKKLWERLRRKSHVERTERKKLVAELFDIITGRVKDFVFKHDSVRVIQTALKYANVSQRRMIARELQGQYKDLAESRYAKFLIGKILVHGDEEVRDLVVPEFYTHVRRMIKHPEASWILDDVYRGVATPRQKASLLSEWYGAEFALFKPQHGEAAVADLKTFLEQKPEKRVPVMRSLHDLINLLVQKKTTAFTMLHDAMLQYFLNTPGGSSEANEFVELLKGDEEGDLLKNLAFTQSGSRLVCLALAHGTAKDRKHILRVYKGLIQTLANDIHGHQVLLTAYEVIDDTVLVSKSIFPELVGDSKSNISEQEQTQRQLDLFNASIHLTARIPMLHLFSATPSKAILPPQDQSLIQELHTIRMTTSKKDPDTRRKELLSNLSPSLLELVASQAPAFAESSFGCQFMSEVLLGSIVSTAEERDAALDAILALTQPPASASLPTSTSTSDPTTPPKIQAYLGRLLKSLIQGGRFDPASKTIILTADPPLSFHERFYDTITAPSAGGEKGLLYWATGENSFTIVALLEALGFSRKDEAKRILRGGKEVLRKAATAPLSAPTDTEANGAKEGSGNEGGGVSVNGDLKKPHKKKNRNKDSSATNGDTDGIEEKPGRGKGNIGSKLLLEKIG